MKNIFEEVYNYLIDCKPEILNKSLNDVHVKGLFSLVVNGSENGNLTRIFIAHKKIKPFDAQLHSHRYPIKIGVIKGNIKHHIANLSNTASCDTLTMPFHEYRSPLNGGNGLKFKGSVGVKLKDFDLPMGSCLSMSEREIHTISCSKGSIWIVQEQGFKKDYSEVLGVPFITENLYNEPKQFQINDNYQLVLKHIKKLIGESNV